MLNKRLSFIVIFNVMHIIFCYCAIWRWYKKIITDVEDHDHDHDENDNNDNIHDFDDWMWKLQ
jgi:hypothetical protein